ncbi:PAS domain-containing sensor histidine kinase [Brevibacillus sp. H7]|uniref:PAS domain-containing sensor histidine kinase n=1 Tax=Brevibacillus sp. H7 TaxID=3349138 RepID=UPI0037F1CDD2
MGTQTQMYAYLFKNNLDAVYSIDTQGRFTSINAAAEELSGYKAEELLGMSIWDILTEESCENNINDLIGGMFEGVRKNRHFFIRHKLGHVLEVSVTSFPIMENGEMTGRYAIAKDITMQKRTEEALRKTESHYRLISENVLDLIRVIDINGVIQYASPSHVTVMGMNPDELLSKSCLSFIHPDEQQKATADLHAMIQEKKPCEHEYHYVHANGDTLLFAVKGRPVVGDNGEVEHVVVVARDVTERRRAEDLLRNSDKLSVLGELAAGIAHEIRNPLTSLKGFIQLLQSERSANEHYLQIMLSEIDRITFITSELLLLAKPQALHYRQHALLPILQSVMKLLEPQANLKNIRFHICFSADSLFITCEEYQIKQVFINIIKNGIEAMPSGGILTIDVRVEADEVMIRFIDEGNGIPKEVIPKLGEPFYSTKEKGTGLGLMVSYKIIRDHRGRIAISSSIGQGTTVEIRMPIARE